MVYGCSLTRQTLLLYQIKVKSENGFCSCPSQYPVGVMDHMSPIFADIFPDSKIAKGFAAARTKTTCILNLALRPHFEAALVSQMQEEPFSLAIDGSNDNDIQKMNPVTIRVLDTSRCHVSTKFLDMCLSGTASTTAESIL